MRANRPIHPVLFLLLATVACASAPMGRGASEGDEIGGGDDDSSGGSNDDDGPATGNTDDGPTGESGDDATDDPTVPGLESESGPGETNSGSASATDSDAESTSTTDPTDPTDATESSGEDTGMGESTSDSGDTETPAEVDLSGYILVQTDSAREFVIPDGVSVLPGTVIVIGRGASQASFENFWGTAWGDEVVYFEGADSFPTINGDETYSLLDPGSIVVDGPTPALVIGTSMARTDAGLDAGNAAAWDTAIEPNLDSTPGVSDATGGTSGQPYISEYSDPTGSGNFDFEFVEIHVPE